VGHRLGLAALKTGLVFREAALWNLAPKPLWMIQAVWSLDRTPTRGRGVLCEPFHAAFPSVPLPLSVEALGAVIALVLDGRCAFAVAGSLRTDPAAELGTGAAT
jgi:hypothetical protein